MIDVKNQASVGINGNVGYRMLCVKRNSRVCLRVHVEHGDVAVSAEQENIVFVGDCFFC